MTNAAYASLLTRVGPKMAANNRVSTNPFEEDQHE